VLLTAQAQVAEESDPERALNLALEAHGLAPDLVPAAAIAGRLLASRGNTPRAAKILQKTWTRSPHPDLATAYAYARIGDSPRDRLDRVKQLAALSPNSLEGPIAEATTAIDARQHDAARAALEPLVGSRMTQRVATLMARIEGEQHGDKGRVREWLARAVNAPRDPAWTADGVIADQWAPISPVTGALDAFQWRVPVESMDRGDGEMLAAKLEELVALGGPEGGSSADEVAAARKKVDDATTIEVVPVTEPARKAGASTGNAAEPQRKTAPAKPVPQSAPESAPESAPVIAPAARQTTASVPPTSSGRTKSQSETETRRKPQPRIFVPPPAPDDPGPEGSQEEIAPPLRPKPA
jgi:HemY protein